MSSEEKACELCTCNGRMISVLIDDFDSMFHEINIDCFKKVTKNILTNILNYTILSYCYYQNKISGLLGQHKQFMSNDNIVVDSSTRNECRLVRRNNNIHKGL